MSDAGEHGESEIGRPPGYRQPVSVWAVECRNPRETEPMAAIQLGAFTSERQARRLLRVAPQRYAWATDFRLNHIAMHRSLEDWEWDR